MPSDDASIKRRLLAQEYVSKWEQMHHAVDPVAVLLSFLNAADQGAMPQWNSQLSPLARDVFHPLYQRRRWPKSFRVVKLRGDLTAQAHHLMSNSKSTSHFERFLDELSLTSHPELVRCAARLTAHGLPIELGRDTILGTYLDSTRYIWRLLFDDTSLWTLITVIRDEEHTVSLLACGAISEMAKKRVLWTIYEFLASFVYNSYWLSTMRD